MRKTRNLLALAAIAALGLSACGQSAQTATTAAATTAAAAETTTAAAETTAAAAETTASGGTDSADDAGDYPNGNIRIVSHSNVGSNDLYIRALQPYLQQELGANIVIENVTGAAGRLAANEMWTSDPDGYNLFSMTIPLITASDILYDADYDVMGFEYIYSFDNTPYCLVVKSGSPYTTFDELLEGAKTKELTNGTSGVGGSMHLQSMVMKDALGIDYTDVPFDGSSNAVLGVMSGDVDLCICPADVGATNEGEVTILAILGTDRVPYLPDVPSTHELGYDFTTLDSVRGIVAPPGTPKAICDKIAGALERAIQYPEFQEWLSKNSFVLEERNSEEYKAVSQSIYDAIYQLKDMVSVE
ncbi:MAG: tripartite tricarboxylate transporter substrate binding protein [Clostridiales bacterium]|nr:tripartite tricarboxylate transporter substrate binding protein [Clostridiales bacterium]